MASCDYDEDLESNPFFVSIRRDFPDLFQQSLKEGFVLAIPRRGSVDGLTTFERQPATFNGHVTSFEGHEEHLTTFDRDVVLRHVLVANDDFDLSRFHTLDGVAVVVVAEGDVVKVFCDERRSDDFASQLRSNDDESASRLRPSQDERQSDDDASQTRFKGDENASQSTLKENKSQCDKSATQSQSKEDKSASQFGQDPETVTTKLLFSETFYDEDMNKLQLWCVADPLMKICREKTSKFEDPLKTASTLLIDSTSVNDCVDFLRKFVGGQSLLIRIQELSREFQRAVRSASPSYSNSEIDNLTTDDVLITEANLFYKSAVNAALSHPHVRNQNSWHLNILLSVETYFLHCVHRSILDQLFVLFAQDDATLNRFIRLASSSKSNPSSFGIRENLHRIIPKARKELTRISEATTPRSKLECLNRSFSAILNESSDSDFVVSADDLLPTLIFILTKTGVANWTAQLHYMSDFLLAKKFGQISPQNAGDKTSFQLATLEAALEHIKSGGLSHFPERSSSELKVSNYKTSNPKLEKLFFAIEDNDVQEAKNILDHSSSDSPDSTDPSSEDRMCHPLCSCEKCRVITSEKNFAENGDKSKASLFQSDDRGWTPLHVAARSGRPLLIELFLNFDRRSADIVDTDGRTALHVAAVFGHQNALLLLLHADVDFNVEDKEGNSPLILAASNGNTSCVKALLYYAEHQSRPIDLNAQNVAGETSLHVASRWGFIDIVRILIDSGAKVNTKNKRRETPISSSHNLHLAVVLKAASILETQKDCSHETFASILTQKFNDKTDEESEEKVRRLFKSVKVGDLQLVAFYLGVEKLVPSREQVDVDGCHQFCDCVKCVSRHQLSDPQLARRGKIPILARRSKDKVSINATDTDGRTALHVAAVAGNLSISNLLLRAGALQTQDVTGQTPLHLACQNGHLAIVDSLLSSGRSDLVNLQDRRGLTGLHLSVDTGNYDIVNLLLNRGANVNLKNNAGRSAVQEAKNNVAILELINKHLTRNKH